MNELKIERAIKNSTNQKTRTESPTHKNDYKRIHSHKHEFHFKATTKDQHE